MGSAAELSVFTGQADEREIRRLLVKKLIATIVLMASGTVFAQDRPTIIGHINNKHNGQIVFTTDQGQCKDGTLLTYIEDSGGKIHLVGCWRKVNNKVFVVWSDGDVFSYDIENMNFTREWMEYSNR